MKALVTGSSGHLGEALVRTLRDQGAEVIGVDIVPSAYTNRPGNIIDRQLIRENLKDVDTVFHTATLHKPHVGSHSMQQFIDTNITGTLTLLEASVEAGVKSFVFTSTTSVFGDALVPPAGEPAAWITEEVRPIPKNIYGVTKASAEEFCQLFWRRRKLPCVVLRTSRFFPEEDDDQQKRDAFTGDNLKANEYLFRRVDIGDAVDAHLLAAERAGMIGFDTFIVSATSPFTQADLQQLRTDAPAVVKRYYPAYEEVFQKHGWRMLPGLDRVYVNAKAREILGWRPQFDFGQILRRLDSGQHIQSALARLVGAKGYHAETSTHGPYTVR